MNEVLSTRLPLTRTHVKKLAAPLLAEYTLLVLAAKNNGKSLPFLCNPQTLSVSIGERARQFCLDEQYVYDNTLLKEAIEDLIQTTREVKSDSISEIQKHFAD